MAAAGAHKSRCTEAMVGCADADRFVLELEFVQCLANPMYLSWLAQSKYFDDPAFVHYLRYLRYWKQPQYAKYIIYPHALYFLDLLQDADFRKSIGNHVYAEHVRQQQDNFFQNFWSNRAKEEDQLAMANKTDAAGAAAAAALDFPATAGLGQAVAQH